MATYLDFLIGDTFGQHATMRVPITGQTAPAAVTTYAGALQTAIFGSGKICVAGTLGCNMVITNLVTPIAAQSGSEVREKWSATMIDEANNIFRFTVPGRNDDPSFIAPGTEIAADLTNAVFTSALEALVGAATVHMINPRGDGDLVSWRPVLSTVKSRKRPRIGGRR